MFTLAGIAYDGSVVQLDEQTKNHDAREPAQTDHDGDPAEVALGDRGTADGRLHSATEHVGKTAALPLVHQHQQHQQQAEDDQGDLEPQNHGWSLLSGNSWLHVRTTGAGRLPSWPPQGYDGSALAH